MFLGLSLIACGNNVTERNITIEETTETSTTTIETMKETEARNTYSGVGSSSNSKSSYNGSSSGYTSSKYDNDVHVNKKSSYWYDSPSERKRKADETLMKYYEYDENGNLVKKEGTIVNGKPYHKSK